jgi:hypothetical protein
MKCAADAPAFDDAVLVSTVPLEFSFTIFTDPVTPVGSETLLPLESLSWPTIFAAGIVREKTPLDSGEISVEKF